MSVSDEVTRILLVAAVFLASATAAPVDAQTTRGDTEYRHLYRYGIPDGASVSTLSDQPEVLDFLIAEEPEFSEAGIASLVEYHAVYPLAATELLAAITAYGDYTRISRRVTESTLLEPPPEPPYEPIGALAERHAALMRTSFRFLVFGREYDYRLSSMTERLENGGILVRSRMTESLDGGLADIRYSWYLEPLDSGGPNQTYLRYFTRVDFAEEPDGLRLALELFARNDVERLLESIYRYARTGR
jgi:hypothetical protein